VSDDLDPVRRLRPDRRLPDEPNDPRVLAEEKDRLMAIIEPDHQQAAWRHLPAIYPRLAYDDEVSALDFLIRAFGFTERREARMEDDEWGMLAWLEYGDGVVMIGRASDDAHAVHGLYSPRESGNSTCMINVMVDDVDAHYEQARREGARIVMEIEDAFYGFRRYEALDSEGHRWHFTEPIAHVRERRGT
jgi:PhnB protein